MRSLLAAGGLSQRQIARRMGVSRGSVGAIASGRRPDYADRPAKTEDAWEQPSGPPERCPGCGGLVFMPCVLCAARKRLADVSRPRSPQTTSEATVIVGLELRPEHRKRYEKVRARRQSQGETPSIEQPALCW